MAALSLSIRCALAVLLCAPVARSQSPWPAEAWTGATNLTALEGPAPNDFYEDLSGASWNPLTRRLWLCRNGPSGTTSKLWVLRESGGSFVVDTRSGNRGEWTSFGDLEAVTQADLAEDVVYLMIEGEERIKAYSVSAYGTATLLNNWNTAPFLPLSGGNGAEGIAFVPDSALGAAGFVDAAGQPRISHRGMGGLMFVAHQNGGKVYVFDLDRSNSTFDFVGSYLTNASESAELFFDRSTGLLLILHGNDVNTIEVSPLTSHLTGGQRQLDTLITYDRPTGSAPTANIEGLTLMSAPDCSGGRSLFLTIDDGGAESLLWFHHFPCGRTPCPADWDVDGQLTPSDVAQFITAWLACLASPGPPPALAADFDASGAINPADVASFINAWFAALSSGC